MKQLFAWTRIERSMLLLAAIFLVTPRAWAAHSFPTDAPLPGNALIDIKDTSYAVPDDAVFISPTGSASNLGTFSSPWSFAKAITSAPAGSTIVLRGGNYYGIKGQNFARRLTLQAYPHEKPWIRGDLPVTNWTSDGAGHWSTPSNPAPAPTLPRPPLIRSTSGRAPLTLTFTFRVNQFPERANRFILTTCRWCRSKRWPKSTAARFSWITPTT